jgi:hypothetical protein
MKDDKGLTFEATSHPQQVHPFSTTLNSNIKPLALLELTCKTLTLIIGTI